MLLTKSCHDLDWLSYVVGVPAARVSSFGSRTLFTAANKPAEASDRCVTCAIEPELRLLRGGDVPRRTRCRSDRGLLHAASSPRT